MVITTSIIMVMASAIPRLRYSPDVEDEVCTSVSFIISSVSTGVRDDGKVFLYPRVGSCYTASFIIACTNAHTFNMLDSLTVTSHLIVAPLVGRVLKYYSVRDLNIRSRNVLRACNLSLRMKERKSRDKKYYLEHYLFMQK